MKTRGLTSLELILVLALLGATGAIAIPKLFTGETGRAKDSKEATDDLLKASQAQGASAAAGVQAIQTANSMAEPSPTKDFIEREVPMVLAKLPNADPAALLEAEKRRSAVMEGRWEEAQRLYGAEAKRAARLQEERDEAVAARRAADAALLEAAAANRARTQQMMGLGALAVLLAGGWAWTKLNGIGVADIAKMAADVRMPGTKPIDVIDKYVPTRLWDKVRQQAKQHLPLAD